MAHYPPCVFQALDQSLPLGDRLTLIHQRLEHLAPAIERVAFALYQPRNDLLSTYVSHNSCSPNLSFYDAHLATIPSLKHLADARCCRVIDDMAVELPPGSTHSNWLLEQGWRSSYTVPLFAAEGLQGFLFFNGFEPGLFTPELLQQLEPHVELLGSLIAFELARVNSLRVAVQLALQLTGMRDPETGAHVERVSLYSRLVAMELGKRYALRSDFAEDLYLFAALHDVGKVAIADQILRKPGPLNAEERLAMQDHVNRGIELVDDMVSGLRLVADPKVAMLRQVVSGHHEKLDGSGYPLGLTAPQIPLEARIVAVADIYDALSQVRPYKPALPESEVVRILAEMADRGQIDAECLEVLLAAADQRRAIAAAYRDPIAVEGGRGRAGCED